MYTEVVRELKELLTRSGLSRVEMADALGEFIVAVNLPVGLVPFVCGDNVSKPPPRARNREDELRDLVMAAMPTAVLEEEDSYVDEFFVVYDEPDGNRMGAGCSTWMAWEEAWTYIQVTRELK